MKKGLLLRWQLFFAQFCAGNVYVHMILVPTRDGFYFFRKK